MYTFGLSCNAFRTVLHIRSNRGRRLFCCEQVLGVHSFKARQEHLRHLECRNVIAGRSERRLLRHRANGADGRLGELSPFGAICLVGAQRLTPLQQSDDCAFLRTSFRSRRVV